MLSCCRICLGRLSRAPTLLCPSARRQLSCTARRRADNDPWEEELRRRRERLSAARPLVGDDRRGRGHERERETDSAQRVEAKVDYEHWARQQRETHWARRRWEQFANQQYQRWGPTGAHGQEHPPPHRRSRTPLWVFSAGCAIVFYFANLDTVPISGRTRFSWIPERWVLGSGERGCARCVCVCD